MLLHKNDSKKYLKQVTSLRNNYEFINTSNAANKNDEKENQCCFRHFL